MAAEFPVDPDGTASDSADQASNGGVTWRAFYHEACAALGKATLGNDAFPSPESDARRIIEEAAGFEPSEFYLGLDQFATVRGVAKFDALLPRRLAGEPLQYVLGRWSFRTLDLMVDHRVLIPRPETETVAEFGLRELERQAAPQRELLAADLGTGSGAIGLSLAAERVDVRVICTDASGDAVAVARANLAGIGRPAARVQILEGSWFLPLAVESVGAFNLIISNPPYVAENDPLPTEVASWEPAQALFSGNDGLDDARVLIAGAIQWLAPRGALVLELGETQLDAAAQLATDAGYDAVLIHQDLTGRDRVLVCRK